jgi:hypothetical protein
MVMLLFIKSVFQLVQGKFYTLLDLSKELQLIL